MAIGDFAVEFGCTILGDFGAVYIKLAQIDQG